MKILFVGCSSCWHTAEWINYFSNQHEVYLFSDKKDYLPAQNHANNITIIHSTGLFGWLFNWMPKVPHVLRRLNKMLSLHLFRRRINKILKEKKIDIIHAHSLYYGYLVSFVSGGVPIVFTPMGSDVIIHAQKNTYYRKMAEHAFAAANVITGDSKLLKKRGLAVGARENDNYVIQNGVDSKRFYPFETTLKKELGMKKDEFLFFSPRALDENYNIDVIIDALALVKKTVKNFKCVFAYAFGGEYFSMLSKKVEELDLKNNMVWLGYTQYNDMPIYYNSADIVISIPTSDSSPKSVYESMFCGTPVILSDIDWVYEICDDYHFIEKVPPRSAERLAEALLKLAGNSGRREEMSQIGLMVAQKHFDYDLNMKKMEAIMQEALT